MPGTVRSSERGWQALAPFGHRSERGGTGTGLPLSFGEEALEATNHFSGAVSSEYRSVVPAGLIVSTTPAPGTIVPIESTVDLVVSLGPRVIAVPDVSGLSETEAGDLIVAASLSPVLVGEGSATVPSGTILRQDPLPGTLVVEASPVLVVVSVGAVPAVVPNLLGTAQAEAETLVVAASPSTDTVSSAPSATFRRASYCRSHRQAAPSSCSGLR